ncbi:MAG: hypothetical protein HC933_04020 [Pleurocapsa sp. SU_196_0]|nr:hypothetical protein [Pleurocapsa sp. SU_196_0]
MSGDSRNEPDQRQDVGDHATALQAGGNITIHHAGMSYTDVRDIALDVFNQNFFRLSESAAATARQRAEEITDRFLGKLQVEYPQGLAKAEDPDFQYALFTLQKQYARTGDADLAELLMNLLSQRAKENGRTMLQIVLNESLEVAAKLTPSQVASLSLIFSLRYAQI